ncbi:DUF1540 domain-containing protein [Paenibacillus sp. NPDC056579]|uniref:DUF1540 domain-containing protein n=1 Tax=unclassified Paenibacillus TaxID=185978 RepID=UPI001EF7CC6F|nr:DUF1540 domain-containing protein [Paenibacillus sp. H1-7]ULL17630.1 DUF1540 domain-containing protein [Paenibacillus sp. H1-7]
MPDVKCSVANCTYWAEGNNCAAKSIMIEIDKHANADLNSEFAEDFEGHQDQATSVRNTCCHTFKAKK